MSRIIFWLVFLFPVVFFNIVQAQEDNIVQEATGLAANERDALIDAKRNAVEKAIGVMLISQTEVKNFMLNRDIVLTETQGSVKSYELLSKTKTANGLFEITIKAVVSKSSISKDLAALKILLESMDKPRVMVLIRETNMGSETGATKAAETAIIDFLKSKEFNMVDPAVVAALIGSNDKTIEDATKGDAGAAAKIGRDNGAEVILVGTAVSTAGQKMEMLGPMVPCGATVSIRAVTCATGKIITAKQQDARITDINQEAGGQKAITKAAKKLMDKEVFEQIISAWQDVINNGMAIRVIISGVTNFKIANMLGPYLEGMSGNIVKANKRNWNKDKGKIEFEIQYKGSAEGFCTEIDEKPLQEEGKFSVSDFTANSASIEVIK
ncbi:MAG: hypothetical protein ABIA63_08415 [bacterium]